MGRLLVRHLARNASIPVITVAAIEISNLLAGAVIVETVFAWPGLGQVTVQFRQFGVGDGVIFRRHAFLLLYIPSTRYSYATDQPSLRDVQSLGTSCILPSTAPFSVRRPAARSPPGQD